MKHALKQTAIDAAAPLKFRQLEMYDRTTFFRYSPKPERLLWLYRHDGCMCKKTDRSESKAVMLRKAVRRCRALYPGFDRFWMSGKMDVMTHRDPRDSHLLFHVLRTRRYFWVIACRSNLIFTDFEVVTESHTSGRTEIRLVRRPPRSSGPGVVPSNSSHDSTYEPLPSASKTGAVCSEAICPLSG